MRVRRTFWSTDVPIQRSPENRSMRGSLAVMQPARRAVCVGLFLLALIPRLLYVASIPQDAILESVDARGYDLLARNLLAGHGFSLHDVSPLSTGAAAQPEGGRRAAHRYQPDGLRTPLYPVLVATVYTLAGQRPAAVAVAQALLEGFTTLIVGALAGALLGRRAGAVAAALYALTPVQWRYTAALLTEIPLAFLLAVALWLLTRLVHAAGAKQNGQQNRLRQKEGPTGHLPGLGSALQTDQLPAARWRRTPPGSLAALGCGTAAGLAGLCKPNVAGLAVILALTAFWSLREEPRRALAAAAAIVFAAAAVLSPWAVRNWVVFGRPFLSNASLGYVARVAAPATLAVVEGHQTPPWSPEWEAHYHAIVTQAAARYGWSLDPVVQLSAEEADRRERQIARVAWDIVLAHPWDTLRAHWVGFLRSWAPQEQTFWYAHLSGRPWEGTGVAPNTLRDAVDILCDGQPIEALTMGFGKPWEQLDPLARALWYGWALGHLLAIGLMGIGLWRLRHRALLAAAMAATILYATLPPGPIGYVRFRVPVVPLIAVLEIAGAVWLGSKLRSLLHSAARAILATVWLKER